MGEKIRDFLRKNKHLAIVLYFPIYMAWFEWLEHREHVHHMMIHCRLDDLIPFNELFAIPYFMWFAYVVFGLAFLFLNKKCRGNFYRLAAILMLGMTTSLLIYTILPNAQPLRPETFPRDNALTRMLGRLYHTDTPTNVCPSIHVYNSLCVHIALAKSAFAAQKSRLSRILVTASLILCVSICLATMFLKQHSVIDVICAIVLYGIFYRIIYHKL